MNQIDFNSDDIKNKLAAYQEGKELFITNCMARGLTCEHAERLFMTAQFSMVLCYTKRFLTILKNAK